MNRTQIMLAVVELAKTGGTLAPEDAISAISAMIDKLDPVSDSYERDVEALMKIGATIWSLAQRKS